MNDEERKPELTWCPNCERETAHTLTIEGIRETMTCNECGARFITRTGSLLGSWAKEAQG